MEKKSIVHPSSSSSVNYGRRITRSMTKSATEAQGTVVANSNGSSLKIVHSYPPYPKQVGSKKRKTRNMPFLPEEILFQIFLLLPAKVLHEVMRTVCRTWRKIIRDPDFIKAHLCRSPVTAFFCDRFPDNFTATFIDRDETTGKFNERKGGLISLEIPKKYLTSGDGLLLTSDQDDPRLQYLINPLTKQIVKLPRLPVSCNFSRLCAVGCSPLTLECKVVFTHYASKAVGTHPTYILTVGVDEEWRAIRGEPSEHLSSYSAQGISGFIYWYSRLASYVIALDLETEVFYKVLLPEECRGQYVDYMSSDRFLSFALKLNVWENALLEVEFWELVDCKSGEWRKCGRIDWERKRRELNEMGFKWNRGRRLMSIRPVAVLNNRDVAIFHFEARNSTFVAYNFKTGRSFHWFHSSSYPVAGTEFQHVNSLVVLKTYPKVLFQEAVNMLEKLEIFWQEQGVHVDELLQTHKLKDVATTLKNKSLSQATSEKYFTSS